MAHSFDAKALVATMDGTGGNVQDLVDCFDEIPEMMSRIKSSQQNKSRFQILEPNHSYSVAHVLRGNRSMEATHPGNVNQVSRMVLQAKKVLDHLNQIPRSKTSKDVETSAKLAEQRLRKLTDSGVDLNKFYQQYDVNRNGRVSYKDFSDVLLSVSSGISREDAMQLASKIDKNKAGAVEYNNILGALQKLGGAHKESAVKAASKATPSLSQRSAKEQNDKFEVAVQDITLTADMLPLAPASPARAPYSSSAYVPKDMITLEALSPTVYEKKKANVFNAEIDVRESRRFFHQRPVTQVTAQLKARIPPFHVDPTQEEKRQRKRSHSEPPRGGRTLTQQLVQGGLVQGASAYEKQSLRSSLLKEPQAQSASPLDKESREVINPLKRMINVAADRKEQVRAMEGKVAENAIVLQMQGNTTVLRHLLKQQDRSRSGYVNADEFRKALLKSGVLLDKPAVEALFEKNAVRMPSAGAQDAGLSKGKALSIEAFVDQIQARTAAPALSHVLGDGQVGRDSRAAEQVRVMKRVLHSVSKLSNPQKLFNDVGGRSSSSLSVQQLRESLQLAGSCLSDAEFKVLVSGMDVNRDGRISLQEFDDYLRGSVTNFEKDKQAKLCEQLQQAPHYSRSYMSSGALVDTAVPEFQRLDQTRQSRKDRRQWDKLKEHLQQHHGKVLKAFAASDSDLNVDAAAPQLSIQQLCRNLGQVGVLLGHEDVLLLREQVVGHDAGHGEGDRVAMDKFCAAMGIPLGITKDKNTYTSLDPTAMVRDEGVFASSRHSISANSKYSASYFLASDEDLRKREFGERLRRPQSLGAHLTGAEFWEMRRSVDNPMLFPVAVGGHGPSYSNSLDVSLLRKGIVRMKSQTRLSPRALSQLSAGLDKDSLASEVTPSERGRRSHSAPPSSRSLAQYHASHASSAMHTPIVTLPSESSGSRAQTPTLADKVARWSSTKLSDYFSGRDGGDQKSLPRSDSRESTVSPASYHSASTNSVGTADRFGRGQTKFFNNGDHARGSLRKQFDQARSPAPFATDR